MVVDVDEQLSLFDARSDRAQALEAGAVGGDDAIELAARLWRLQQMVWVQERQLARNGILVPAEHFFVLTAERHGQAKLRPNAISIRPDMANYANTLAAANPFENALNNSRGLHPNPGLIWTKPRMDTDEH